MGLSHVWFFLGWPELHGRGFIFRAGLSRLRAQIHQLEQVACDMRTCWSSAANGYGPERVSAMWNGGVGRRRTVPSLRNARQGDPPDRVATYLSATRGLSAIDGEVRRRPPASGRPRSRLSARGGGGPQRSEEASPSGRP